MSNANKKSIHEDDEVQQLLRAAQDDLLLKLSVDSHMARASSSQTSMDPDLERRFQALKFTPKNTSTSAISTTRTSDGDRNQVKVNITNNISGLEEDDLFARFAALKNSIPSHNLKNDVDSSEIVSRQQEEVSDDEVDEVEKVIKWAIDAARLDPSPLSDDESSEEEEYHNGDRMDGGKKDKTK